MQTRVLQVSTFYCQMGGVERAARQLSVGLSNHGYSVEVLCTHVGRGIARQVVDGIKVTSVGGRLTQAGRPLALNFPGELARRSADVVHYHLPFPLACLAHLVKPPRYQVSVATWHHDIGRYPLLKHALEPFMARFLDSLSAIIVAAPQLIETNTLLKQRADKCVVIPFGVDPTLIDRFADERALEIRSQYGNRPIVLFAGRLVYYKGIEVLIRAMKDQQGAMLLISGEGPLRSKLESQVKDMGTTDSVRFLGRLPDEELMAHYKACDVFVLPSTLPTECFGLVQIEAMMCSKPVVNTWLPTGVPWVSLHEQTGLTVPPGDVAALSSALQRLLANESLRLKLGAAARQRALENFSIEKNLLQTQKLYERLLVPSNERSVAG